MTTTEGKLYLLVLDSNPIERLEIQFVPRELVLSRQPDIPGIKIVGSNVPGYQYTGGETALAYTLDWYASNENRKDVMFKTKWLESLCYQEGFTRPPQRVKMVFGDMFRDEIWVVKSVVNRYSNFHKQFGYLPQQAYSEVVLVLESDFKASQIRGFDDINRLYAVDAVTVTSRERI